ncbi:methylcrotonoyl-CoA carboxylase subunit alpha, mitochondrial isoform X2 [Bacillus rossius redtenbacheri]|uniref:methylcrotonoyl-CoA carboxylase subunit alpha, mitochondrial isoform X2 n=1 Tax=Bacillus rossius redtenbacheri TaxID=93214 RepID=UPI002FDD8EDC
MSFTRLYPRNIFIKRCGPRKWYSSGVGDAVPIDKVLVANRGEIACRVIRTVKKLGMRAVAVYSDADAGAMHVALADEAYRLGPAPSQESYLRQEAVVMAAQGAGCQAVHPGYGFLSENAEFAELCQRAGLTFVGPPASAIRDMGIKSTSKAIMSAAGVPVIQGYHGDDQSDVRLREEAERIGFPVMIKAVRGGGGKGMRVCRAGAEFASQLDSARREALKAFGDGAVLLEQFVRDPRHVEVQVFGDRHGNYVHLFERDCSVQRRHQKVIEEAPAPGVPAQLRAELGRAAVRAARAVGYVGAGTVEFILDPSTAAFHFMEMNTRLQVEHPVTEMVTRTDLVEWQLRVAAGERLPVTQDDIALHGHSFEARIYAESPGDDFLPGAGPLRHLRFPEPGPHVRVETGVRQGDEVSVHYDPMIAKLVVWGPDRAAALRRLRAQLLQCHVVGLDTNVNFLVALSAHPSFARGDVHTSFIPQHRAELFPPVGAPAPPLLAQAVLAAILHEDLLAAREDPDPLSPFAQERGFRVNHRLRRGFTFLHHDQEVTARVTYEARGSYLVSVDGRAGPLRVSGALVDRGGRLELRHRVDDACGTCGVVVDQGDVHLFTADGGQVFRRKPPAWLAALGAQRPGEASTGAGAVAPMPGVVEKVCVVPGQAVGAGDPLVVVIAMKMEHVVRAARPGVVERVSCSPGDTVARNAVLVYFAE